LRQRVRDFNRTKLKKEWPGKFFIDSILIAFIIFFNAVTRQTLKSF